MKFRILSDLHLEMVQSHYMNGINHLNRWKNRRPQVLNTSKDIEENIITLIAGDVSSRIKVRKEFFKLYPEMHGCWIEGNHIVYNDTELSLDELIKENKKEFGNFRMKFLENDIYKIPGSNYIVIGCTLWTDFLLGYDGSEDKEEFRNINMKLSSRCMNDYRWGYAVNDGVQKINLYPEFILNKHKESLEFIKSKLKEYKDYNVIILTHHCPSLKCIPAVYVADKLNSSYASDLDYLIEENPHIKLWVCGHCHTFKEFNIGGTKIVLNPIGYNFENRVKNWNYIIEI